MRVITSWACPNCGASMGDAEVGDVLRCRYCGTEAVVSRRDADTTRQELEIERDQLRARMGEWDARLAEAKTRGPRDVLVPAGGCCGIYAGLFMVGSLILATVGLQQYRTAVGAAAIAAALLGFVAILWRREQRRRAALDTLEQERAAERDRCEERLREIEAELRARS